MIYLLLRVLKKHDIIAPIAPTLEGNWCLCVGTRIIRIKKENGGQEECLFDFDFWSYEVYFGV